ncbi:MAG: ATP-dependent Clp protease ATP-binding subunit [Oscillospiraceae bacterium]
MWGKTIYALDLASLLSGTKYRGDFEERIKAIIDEASGEKDVILFIDEIHIITSAGGAEGAIDAANILKPALARGKIQVIGATTQDEYSRIIQKDTALERRFSKILVEEPDTETAVDILMGIKDKYQLYHKVEIQDEAVRRCVSLSQRYIHSRYLPDKAVDVMDEACARAKLCGKTTVEIGDIDVVISRQTGIPVARMQKQEQERFSSLEQRLSQMILGQGEAVKAMSRAIKRWRVGVSDESRPIATFLFLGPTGVGKTQSCKALAQCLFGSEKALMRIDCTEFSEKNDTSKLIGSPPGYVGYGEGGRLEKELIEKPYSVVLLDEVEKAHPDLHNLLLQAMDNGFITSSQGRKISFRNTVIIMTSNLGAKEIGEKAVSLGFTSTSQPEFDRVSTKLKIAVKERFSPEFIGRIDEIVTFSPLGQDSLEKIAKMMLIELSNRLERQKITVEYGDEVVKKICLKSGAAIYGARDLRSVIREEIENPICDFLLEREAGEKKSIFISAENDKIKVRATADII